MQKLVWQNANGVELDLTSGNYGITEWEGFSNASLNIQSQQVPFQDGGVFLDALIEQRELSVTLAMQDNNNLELRYQNRRELISALNPKLGEGYLI
ncbi:MAG: phage tail family protein, partial [Methanobrevibacter sp.]|nr:phage tail family protein [Methanobrevibacter sp.]